MPYNPYYPIFVDYRLTPKQLKAKMDKIAKRESEKYRKYVK